MTAHTLTDSVTFPCPFCGRAASAGYTDGDARTGTPTVLHALPMCLDFEARDPIAYMRAVNARRVS